MKKSMSRKMTKIKTKKTTNLLKIIKGFHLKMRLINMSISRLKLHLMMANLQYLRIAMVLAIEMIWMTSFSQLTKI